MKLQILPGSKIRRLTVLLGFLVVAGLLAWMYWPAGLDLRDGRHDRGENAIWMQHGWLGHLDWFERNQRMDQLEKFRDPEQVRGLAERLRRYRIRDIYPHLCPAKESGSIPPVDPEATEKFLDRFEGFRVMPWVGGVLGKNAHPHREAWRKAFADSIRELLAVHPRLAGVHINIEPCPSGHPGFLLLLDQVRKALPEGKILSVAAYPPPTLLHSYPEVHWDESYFREVAKRADQLAVMMYDTSLTFPNLYRRLMAAWTREVIEWSQKAEVLLGVPVYDDAGVGYHHPEVENLEYALMGIHRGLSTFEKLPDNYRGVAIYCEWEMDESEWTRFEERFLRSDPARRLH
jgi:hypothetical protein